MVGETAPALAQNYAEVEYLLSGSARTYVGRATDPARVASDGHRYVTRVLARYPKDATTFSGRVVIEPFNTTYGTDRDPLWVHVGTLLQAHGDAWIGVTGRASATVELKRYDPDRYVDVDVATNDFAWDILRHLGTLVKEGGPDSPLSHLPVEFVYLGGYSQSSVETATFAMAFGQMARMADHSPVYDGYFPAAHAASLMPLTSGSSMPRFEFAAMGAVGVPVIDVEPQSDVEGFSYEDVYINPGGASVRREDSDSAHDRFRLYELAGAPHAAMITGCDGPGSSFPTSAFIRAALLHLFQWAEHGITPPRAQRLTLATLDVVSVAEIDGHGNPLGGVRSPFLDVPLARYEAHSTPGPLCKLAGRATILAREVLAGRYRNAQAYVAEFTRSLDETICAGFLLRVDRVGILAAETARAHAVFSSLSESDKVDSP